MKKFFDGGEYFILSSYQISSVPIADNDKNSIDLAKTIFEDACYLSAAGNGQTSLEILRVADDKIGGKIQHIVTIRTHDSAERDCVIRQEALIKGVLSVLHRSGYAAEEISYDCYRQHNAKTKSDVSWALKKQDIQEYGIQGTYKSPSVVESVDWKKIYSALDGSGCSLCIQVIPALLSDNERSLIAENTANCSRAADGIIPNAKDSLAASSAERWKYYARKILQPFAEVNILINGSTANAALLVARVKQSVMGSSFVTLAVPEYHSCSIYNLPWKTALALRKNCFSVFDKWTSDEASQIFQLPFQSNFFIGAEENAFSLIPETELLSDRITCSDGQSICLGKSVFSSQDVFIPYSQLLLHTAVTGKSGTGKTTFLMQLITQLHNCSIPVLIMEPVKREYREIVAKMSNSKIFTVERPVTPLLINPFYVPGGVSLSEYRSSLLSAFKAAFSLPDPLPSLFEKAISDAYTLHGWTDISTSTDENVTVFDMADFIRVFKRVIARSSYSSEVKGNMMSGGAFRLQSLIERCPYTFDTVHSTSAENLLNGCTVLEMGSLEPEQKSLVSALTLIGILAYLKATRESNTDLKNIILIDEAHALLDQGEGATQEEKALNSTMTQLMINIVTEIRAYGVGIIFSDQSPSRIGGKLLDNADNIVSFRLSGEECEMLKEHIGADDVICDVLPLMATGEFLLKNRFLRTPLPIKAKNHNINSSGNHITDEQIAKLQSKYLKEHEKDYRPFSLCECASCKHCSVAAREDADKYATQIFYERQAKLKSPEEIADHIIKLPAVLSSRITNKDTDYIKWVCVCTAIHILRKCAVENGIVFGKASVSKLISDMRNKTQEDRQ